MCFGFLGLQFGFALQNANVSRIFQTLGAKIDDIPILWIAAPLTGLLVQPIVGYYSDRTWNRLGRRRPYFLVGRHPRVAGAHRHAALAGVVDGGRAAVDSRRQHQHRHGAVSRVRRRPASRKAAAHGLRHAELLHRRGLGGGEHAAVDLRAGGCQQRRHGHGCRRDPGHGALLLRHRRGRAGRRDVVDDLHARANIRPASCMALPMRRRPPKASIRAVRPGRARADSRGSRPARWGRTWCGASRSTSSSIYCAAGSRSGAWRC